MFSAEFIRFFLTSTIGLLIDTTIAWLLFSKLAVSLPISSCIGFFVAALFNYVVHTAWTFRSSEHYLSILGALNYTIFLLIIMTIRASAVYLLQISLSKGTHALLILILATTISFIINFIVSKTFIFKPSQRL